MSYIYLVLETLDWDDFNVITATPNKDQAQELFGENHACLVWENGKHYFNMDSDGNIRDNAYDSEENDNEPESGNIFVALGLEDPDGAYVKTVTRGWEFAKKKGYEAACESSGLALIKEYDETGTQVGIKRINSLGVVY